MLSCPRIGCFCLAFVSIANAVSAADRVPPPPRITVTVPKVTVPKPPVVNRPNLPSSRIPIKPPSGTETGRGGLPAQIPPRRREGVPLPGERAAGTPVRASPKAPEVGPQKAGPSNAPTMSGGGGLEGATLTGGGGLSSFPTTGGGGLDTQALVGTGR
jgi:hypothetical protein